MKALVKIMVVVGLCFASTFGLVKLTGAITVDRIQTWLSMASEASPALTGAIVFGLLFTDLFIAVPTLTVSILSGFFLGHTAGSLVALSGLMAAGICGYVLSRRFGDRILRRLLKSDDERQSAIDSFERNGFAMILLSRAVPILPEVTACLAGITGMSFPKFLFAWAISTVPYTLVAAYAGSISTFENPKPAILGAIGISVALWLAWFVFRRFKRQPSRDDTSTMSSL
jgi:uncharacterized membrane protein YdjX (TVP38/TMEM64 family)